MLSLEQSDLVKTISTGKILGFHSPSYKTFQWLGIPYGKPPIRELRWKLPQTPDCWQDILSTINFRPPPIQFFDNKVFGSEDCLHLNVFRPDNGLKNLPVLFYLFGGNNQTGSSQDFDGNVFSSSTNSLVVTIDHRFKFFWIFKHRFDKN